MDKIEFLKLLAKGWFGNSQQHSIHAQLLREKGLGKIETIGLNDYLTDQIG